MNRSFLSRRKLQALFLFTLTFLLVLVLVPALPSARHGSTAKLRVPRFQMPIFSGRTWPWGAKCKMMVIQKQICEVSDNTTNPVTGYYFPAISIPSITDPSGKSLVKNPWNDFHFISADHPWDIPFPDSNDAFLSVSAEAGGEVLEREGKRLGGREKDLTKEALYFEFEGKRWTDAKCHPRHWDVKGFVCREHHGKGYPMFDERQRELTCDFKC